MKIPTTENKFIARGLRMLMERKDYWTLHGDTTRASAYESALYIMEAAWNGDKETLDQFDYYGEE